MSAGVSDQRMKGQTSQASNGPKEQLGGGGGGGETASGSEEFEPWRTQQQQQNTAAAAAAHTAYGASVPISTATDLYNMSTAGYYGSGGTYPYQAYGVGDGTWSNGTDPMTFLSGYHHDSYSMEGMFGPSTTFSTPTAFGQPSSFNYFPSNGDYNTWGSQLGGQRKYDDYYRDPQNMYAQTMPDSGLKSVEQAMQNLDLKPGVGGIDAKDTLMATTAPPQAKKTTWASIASQPAKPQLTVQNQGLKKKGPGMPPGPIVPGKHNMDIGTWDTSKSTPPQLPIIGGNSGMPTKGPGVGGGGGMTTTPNINVRPGWNGPPTNRATAPPNAGPPRPPQHPLQSYQPTAMMPPHLPPPVNVPGGGGHLQGSGLMPTAGGGPMPVPLMTATNSLGGGVGVGGGGIGPTNQNALTLTTTVAPPTHPVLDELRGKNNYNPTDFDLTAPNARFFVIKSYSEDDIHRSIKYEIWCSTEHGNKRLDYAYRMKDNHGNGMPGAVYLFFSVNGSGHFCGMAEMVSPVDYSANSSVWSQDKWKGQFKVRWIYVKDVPNVQLRHIRLENNENKPVTNSRDTQEVPHARGLQVLRIMHSYRHSTSIFDDFVHYEQRQEEEDSRKQPTINKDGHHHDNGRSEHNRDRGDHRRNHERDSDGRDGHRGGAGGGGGGGGGGGHRNNNEHHHHKDNNRGRGGRRN